MPLFPAQEEHAIAKRPKAGKPCEVPPPAVQDIETVSKYGPRDAADKSRSTINTQYNQQYKQDVAPITDFAREVSRRSDHWIEGKATGADDAACALDWLYNWASQRAFLGKANGQGEAVRKWELATFATTFIKISDAPLDDDKRETVKQWLHSVALLVKADYSSHTENPSRQNNHLYWAAWAVAATGIATGDKSLLDWGVDKYRYAVSEIADNGTLKLELGRKARAASYHMFALEPLIMLAEAGETNGIPMYSYDDNRLMKLINLNIAALADPNVIGKLNGYKQEDLYNQSNLGWMEPYYARFHDQRLLPYLQRYRPVSSRRTGGDMTALYLALPVKTTAGKDDDKKDTPAAASDIG